MLLALCQPLDAATLRSGSSGGGADALGSQPGGVLWGDYVTRPGTICEGSEGCITLNTVADGILRLINPNGSANGSVAAPPTNLCAMIYVFDDDEEMGECCGCPLSPTKLETFSIGHDLTSNPGNSSTATLLDGVIAVVSSVPTVAEVFSGATNGRGCPATQGQACNFGCDPTSNPGYSPSGNLFGTITIGGHLFINESNSILEVSLHDDANGDDPNNLLYMQKQCGALAGNGSGTGVCRCPNLP